MKNRIQAFNPLVSYVYYFKAALGFTHFSVGWVKGALKQKYTCVLHLKPRLSSWNGNKDTLQAKFFYAAIKPSSS